MSWDLDTLGVARDSRPAWDQQLVELLKQILIGLLHP
jgi:hypothetical protein